MSWAELEAELARRRRSPAYAAYERVREEVMRMKEAAATDAGAAEPSRYWTEELSGFEYMLDASPLIVERLRHHTYHVTGLRVYDYRSGKHEAREVLERKLRSLLAIGDSDLLVPESPVLGGFGHEIDGALYNLDTLKFFEALLALGRAEVLGAIAGPATKTVIEVGGGWGGFAYQVKTLFPNVRYVIVDLPELFLFSAVYLMTLFPEARVVFAPTAADADQVDRADFVFVPHTGYRDAPLGAVDLAVNMVSFQEMTTAQVRGYVDWLHAFDAPLYSLNRDRSIYNEELSSVRELMAERFWLREIFVLPVSYVEPMTAKRKKPRIRVGIDDPALDGDDRYRHVVGMPRLVLEATA